MLKLENYNKNRKVRISNGVKKTALTFDDGPNASSTLKVLEILKRYKIKACFFLLGENVEYYPRIARRIAGEGHLIGNHTYSHRHLNRLKPEDILFQIERAEEAYKKVLRLRPRFFRPPYGEENKTIKDIAKAKGYRLVGWRPRIKDYQMFPRQIVNAVVSKVRSGSIITLHDGANIRHGQPRINTVRALPEVIETLKAKGFKFVRLDRLWPG